IPFWPDWGLRGRYCRSPAHLFNLSPKTANGTANLWPTIRRVVGLHEVTKMHKEFKKLTDFLVEMGIEQVPHTHKSYLAHLIATYRLLQSQDCPEDVCRAGMFHSIYGTERFQGFKLPLERRGEVQALIGDRAERL